MASSEKTEIRIQTKVPWINGRTPTSFSILKDNPDPIRNNVKVSPDFDAVTI